MSDPFLGELKIFPFVFAPRGWAMCNGQLLPISQNQALFALLGTTYGGNGQTNFALPNLQGRVPMHVGNGLVLGEVAGEIGHTLTLSELPAHPHGVNGSPGNATVVSPTGTFLATSPGNPYVAPPAATTLSPAALSIVGGGQAHENVSPYLVLNVCIALLGIFPSQN